MANAIANNNDLSGVLVVAGSAQTTATTAITNAATALTTANTAQTTATGAQTTANNAQTTANSAQATANQVNNYFFGGTVSGGHTTWANGGAGISILSSAFFTFNSAGGFSVSGSTASFAGITGTSLSISGSKTFKIEDPSDPSKSIIYYCTESPKVVLQDFGTGTLVAGTVTITVDPTFSRVTEDILRATATPTGDCKGLYISAVAVDRSSFTVKECQGGTSNVSFNWMAWATRNGYMNAPVNPSN